MQTDRTDDHTNTPSRPVPHGLFQKALFLSEQETDAQPTEAIVFRDGIYIIPDNLETSSIKQDPLLRQLVDSVLQ